MYFKSREYELVPKDGIQDVEQPRISRSIHDSDDSDEEYDIPPTELTEDMFGMVACSIIRDTHDISTHIGNTRGRLWRLLTTIMLLVFCVGMQLFLLSETKAFVAAKAVHDIREAYDEFELTMYSNTTLTVNGNHRGIEGFFDPRRFANLSDELQADACRIPLSRPWFISTILLLWTLTCFGEIRQGVNSLRSLVCNTNTCSSMSEALTDYSDGGEVLVSSLTVCMKIVLTVFVIAPRFTIAVVLLWLGSRWLLATNNFTDLILNAIALEFILCLKDMLYFVLMSQKNKDDRATTKILSARSKEPAGICVFGGACFWLFAAVLWVLLYTGFPLEIAGLQTVLPEYRWDVAEVCESWIAWRYCVTSDCPKSAAV